MTHAPLVITMGDPSGVGPEIIAKSFAEGRAPGCVVVGSASVMRKVVAGLDLGLEVWEVQSIEDVTSAENPRVIQVFQTSKQGAEFPVGEVSAESGKAAFDAIVKGIDLAKSGKASGIVTAPIHKEALSAAGIGFPGHTEMLAEFGGAESVAMMLANDEIRTVLVTIHVSLRDAIDRADFDAQMSAIRLAHKACRDVGIDAPRVAVAGLNPHAGEGGLFGQEEIE
ncbi:MAG: 4-hydroxythreonine-4-phosphate dehydrogenase PdxA, partial [Pseudomonadota bacterium]